MSTPYWIQSHLDALPAYIFATNSSLKIIESNRHDLNIPMNQWYLADFIAEKTQAVDHARLEAYIEEHLDLRLPFSMECSMNLLSGIYEKVRLSAVPIMGQYHFEGYMLLIMPLESPKTQWNPLNLHDSRTGLFDRTYGERVASNMYKRCLVDGCPLTLVSIEMSDFAHLEDLHGREWSDMALKEFAETVKKSLRQADTPYYAEGGRVNIICQASGSDLHPMIERIYDNHQLKLPNQSDQPIALRHVTAEAREVSNLSQWLHLIDMRFKAKP